MRSVVLPLMLLAACRDDSPEPPIPGTVHHFVVDDFTFPRTISQARALGDDLDGNQTSDNLFGEVTETLAGQQNLNANVTDIIHAGVVASTVDLQYDDQQPDSLAGARIFGFHGAPATEIRCNVTNGVFVSNRTAMTDAPGKAVLRLPVLADADPIEAEIDGLELDLIPDGTGGFEATVRGGFPAAQLIAATTPKVLQMVNTNPQAHGGAASLCTSLVKTGQDVLTSCAFVGSLLAADVKFGDVPVVSAGFQFHIAPCPGEACSPSPPHDPCHDRMRDGDETATDCGGATCELRCAGELPCQTGSDCQTGVCEAGMCREPTCSDGLRDGFETGVDTGGLCH